MNKHGDHDATCLCCEYLALDIGVHGQHTPDMPSFYCCKARFSDMTEFNWHQLLDKAKECPDLKRKPE